MSQQTWLDRAIGWVSPVRGAKRLRARAAIEATADMRRAYEGAKRGRRTDGWFTSGSSADAEIAAAAPELRRRSRDLVRNNPWAKRGVSIWASNLIGPGIDPRAFRDDRSHEATKAINRLWWRWSLVADMRGHTDFAGLQTRAVRTMIESGEALVLREPRRASRYLPIPMQIQLVEPDRLDSTRDSNSIKGGGWIAQGIEYDQDGVRKAYWILPEHPGETRGPAIKRAESVRHKASDVAHLFDPQRAEQSRGAPWLAAAVMRLRDLDDYDDAELMAKKIAACLAAFIINDEDNTGLGSTEIDHAGKTVESFEPGMVVRLGGAKDVKLAEPKGDGNYPNYMRVQLHAIAAALDLPYELLTGDLSQVNFSSARVGLIEFRRRVRQIQKQVIVPQLCLPVWRWFVDVAQASKALPDDGKPIDADWALPRFEAVQPLDDEAASLMRMRIGKSSWEDEVSADGKDPDDVFDKIVDWNAKFDAKGVILDCDPRHTAKSGAMQTSAPGTPQRSDDSLLAAAMNLVASRRMAETRIQ